MISTVGVRGLKPLGTHQVVKVLNFRMNGLVCKGLVRDPAFDRDWLNKNPIVPAVAFMGYAPILKPCLEMMWTVPSSIPVGAFDGNSLFGLLNASIATELAHFPTGPSLDSPFWLYMITWHIGLFTTMLLGQVGVNGRKQGYW